ncbi:WD repeat-containing protein 53-like [Antedon mediterranea]|uniref:WD repeat-containing protein 53-like n=1 Tax=Antedon mediterranea TaxID=105859 RepID=UPI003AF5A42D
MTLLTKWSEGVHTDSIICLEHNKNDTLSSGGEDHQICLWSDEGKVKSKLKLDDDVTSICFTPSDPNIIYTSSGNKLCLLDIRDFNHVQNCKEFNSEEINEVSINSKETFIATCDDSGDIKVVDLREMRLFKTLQRHKYICSSVKFHPTKGCELLSAGLDCIVNSWDFMKGRNLSSFDMRECPSGEDGEIPSGMYMVNPPLIHSMDVSNDGSKIICGLENGKVQVVKLVGRGKFEPLFDLKNHTRGVSKVKILQVGMKEMVISGGNDGKVLLWEGNKQNTKVQHKKKRVKEEREGKSDQNVPDSVSDSVKSPVAAIEHGSKINHMTSADVGGKTIVYVADQSELISLYDISKHISPQE